MKKLYEKPEVYSEQLAIESLKAQCCKMDQIQADAGKPLPILPACKQCSCLATTPSV